MNLINFNEDMAGANNLIRRVPRLSRSSRKPPMTLHAITKYLHRLRFSVYASCTKCNPVGTYSTLNLWTNDIKMKELQRISIQLPKRIQLNNLLLLVCSYGRPLARRTCGGMIPWRGLSRSPMQRPWHSHRQRMRRQCPRGYACVGEQLAWDGPGVCCPRRPGECLFYYITITRLCNILSRIWLFSDEMLLFSDEML